MTNNVEISSTSILKPKCMRYIREMIASYDVLRSNFFQHLPFFVYWSDCISKRPTAYEALHFAFKYFDSKENKTIDRNEEKTANDYLKELVGYYRKIDNNVANFIKSFREGKRKEIKCEDFKWFPKDKKGNPILSKEYEQISEEFDFAWKCARLWQHLKSKDSEKDKEKLILDFLGINDKQKRISLERSLLPTELSAKLLNKDVESTDFFKSNLHLFSRDYMTEAELQFFLEKACFTSIKEKNGDFIKNLSASNARIKPLDKIWLLGRFYGIHYYGLDFIDQNMPERTVKQFEGIDKSPFLFINSSNDVDELIKNNKSVKVGNRYYSLVEYLTTLYGNKPLLKLLEKKSKEIIAGKERNPYQELYEEISKQTSTNSIVDGLNLANEKTLGLFRQHPNMLKTFIFFGAFVDFFKKYENEIDEATNLINDQENNPVLASFFLSTVISEGLIKSKNLFLILSLDDVNLTDSLGAAILIFGSLFPQKVQRNQISNQT